MFTFVYPSYPNIGILLVFILVYPSHRLYRKFTHVHISHSLYMGNLLVFKLSIRRTLTICNLPVFAFSVNHYPFLHFSDPPTPYIGNFPMFAILYAHNLYIGIHPCLYFSIALTLE